jgi:hypothetical protein
MCSAPLALASDSYLLKGKVTDTGKGLDLQFRRACHALHAVALPAWQRNSSSVTLLVLQSFGLSAATIPLLRGWLLHGAKQDSRLHC